jgi:phage shock protein PspC (stress-responsive transcriptional regulator)
MGLGACQWHHGHMASAQTTVQRVVHHPLRRRPDRGLLGGVGAGLAEHLGVEVLLVRCVMAMVVVVGGIGIAIYALAWALIPVAAGSEQARRPRGAWREAVVIVLAVGGVLIGLRHTGFWLGDWLVWPLVLGSCGMALVWRPIVVSASLVSSGRRPGLRGLLRSPGRIDAPRLVIGGLLVAVASASLLHTTGVLRNLGDAIGAVAVITTALGLLIGPWFVRLARNLATERAARIREQERAEVAAHLHDSVLQTLALIQKRADDPREVAGLARRQERELRRWLFERPGGEAGDSLKLALERVAAEVEELHGVPIEVVVVGEEPLDVRLQALVLAAREAMTNAAKFAHSDQVDLYAELGSSRAEVFVRDRGQGFDPQSIPEDRRGVRDSIVGRVERHGGQVCIRSAPGEGTEVELVMESPRA